MLFQRVKTPGLGHNAYMIGCGGGQAVVVDPRRDVGEYLQIARSNNLTITHVLETHRQEDFEFGSRNLQQATGAKIVTGKHELFGKSDIQLADGEELKIGATRFVGAGHSRPHAREHELCDLCQGLGRQVLGGADRRFAVRRRNRPHRPDRSRQGGGACRPAVRLGAREDQAARRADAGAAGARCRLGVRRQCVRPRRHHARHRVRDQSGVHDEPRRVRPAQGHRGTAAPALLPPHGGGQPRGRSSRCRRTRASTCCSRRCSASGSTAAC